MFKLKGKQGCLGLSTVIWMKMYLLEVYFLLFGVFLCVKHSTKATLVIYSVKI